MPTLTIPQKLLKKDTDLVVIPRKEYEALMRTKNGSRKPIDSTVVVKHTMKVPKKYEKFYDGVDKELTEVLRDVRAGKVSKSFETTDELFKFLDRQR